jgi:hypothetical protein
VQSFVRVNPVRREKIVSPGQMRGGDIRQFTFVGREQTLEQVLHDPLRATTGGLVIIGVPQKSDVQNDPRFHARSEANFHQPGEANYAVWEDNGKSSGTLCVHKRFELSMLVPAKSR